MNIGFLRRLIGTTSLLAGALSATTPALAERAPQAGLVHCGQETCLRISGHWAQSTLAVRIDGHDLPVEGGRQWRITVPLATARGWGTISGDMLQLALIDTRNNIEREQHIVLPPGALGRRVELATLMVSAR